LRKATVNFVIYVSVRLSVRPHGTTRLPQRGFRNFYIFRESVGKGSFRGNMTIITLFYMKSHIILGSILARFFLKWQTFQTEFVEAIKTNKTFFGKSCLSRDEVEKWDRVRQATDENMVRHMRINCWITKATGKRFHGNNDDANAPPCHIIYTFPVL